MKYLLLLPTLFLLACPTDRDNESDAGPDLGNCEASTENCEAGEGRPGRRSELSGIYDTANKRMVMFGGSVAIPVQCNFPAAEYADETWAYDDRCNTWKQIAQGASPGPRSRHNMTYDSVNQRALLFGGRFRVGASGNYTNFNDVWQLDLENDTWSEMPASTVNNPEPRVNASFVVNNEGTRAYMFGGNLSLNGLAYNPQNDIWEFNLQTNEWTELQPSGPLPDVRLFQATLWDKDRERMVVFSGADALAFGNTAVYYRDVWAYTPATNSWELLHDGLGNPRVTVPAGRFWGEWVHDTVNDQYTLFGGHDDLDLGNVNDTWVFDPDSNEWSLVTLGDTPNRESNGFCDFPADFTNVDQDVPERRNAHVVVYADGDCKSVITAMGKTDCGAADDVFRFKVNGAQWEQMIEAREGEMCLRTDAEFGCGSMCD